MSCCGSHFRIITLDGTSDMSASHFQMTRCFRRENTFTKALLYSSGIFFAGTIEPRLKKMNPSSPEPVKKSSISYMNEYQYDNISLQKKIEYRVI